MVRDALLRSAPHHEAGRGRQIFASERMTATISNWPFSSSLVA
jgi:hypothetical protein